MKTETLPSVDYEFFLSVFIYHISLSEFGGSDSWWFRWVSQYSAVTFYAKFLMARLI